jgi:hypothetical protein
VRLPVRSRYSPWNNCDTRAAGTLYVISGKHILEELESYGRAGKYREAIRAYLKTDGLLRSERKIHSALEIKLQLQYAMALQHAGFYGLSQDSYQRATEAAQRLKGGSGKGLFYNAQVQRAVLLERFGRPGEALNLLDQIGPPQGTRDARLACASLQSWVDITRMKSSLALGDRQAAHVVATRCLTGDWNQALWGTLVLAILDLVENKLTFSQRRKAQLTIELTLEKMEQIDRPGMPWLALLAGEQLRARFTSFSRMLLERSQAEASRLGKFFVVAASSEQLCHIYMPSRQRVKGGLSLRRAMNAFARCGVLLMQPFRERIFSTATSLWGAEDALDAFMLSAGLAPVRSDLIFAKMCAARARQRSALGDAVAPWQVFEEFVGDWAVARYPGRLRYIEAGRESADVLIVRGGKGIVIQAKHVRQPKKHIPRRLYLRNIVEGFGITEIERYVLVISTSDQGGWRDAFWDVQATMRVRNLVPDSRITVEVVLEPELQTDVLLDLPLYDKFFREIGL